MGCVSADGKGTAKARARSWRRGACTVNVSVTNADIAAIVRQDLLNEWTRADTSTALWTDITTRTMRRRPMVNPVTECSEKLTTGGVVWRTKWYRIQTAHARVVDRAEWHMPRAVIQLLSDAATENGICGSRAMESLASIPAKRLIVNCEKLRFSCNSKSLELILLYHQNIQHGKTIYWYPKAKRRHAYTQPVQYEGIYKI